MAIAGDPEMYFSVGRSALRCIDVFAV